MITNDLRGRRKENTLILTSNHNCPYGSLLKPLDNWSCFWLEGVLHDQQTVKCEVTLNYVPGLYQSLRYSVKRDAEQVQNAKS